MLRGEQCCRGGTGERFEVVQRRLTDALEREASSDAPRSACALASALGTTVSKLRSASRDGFARLVEARERFALERDERLRAIVVPALKAELVSRYPRSVRALERSLDVPPKTCARLAPRLHRLLVGAS